MLNLFKKKSKSPIVKQLKSDPIFKVHSKYWAPAPQERDELLSRYPDKLSEKEKLRILHLLFIEYFNSEKGRKHFDEEDFDDEVIINFPSKNICEEIIESLLGKESAFCSRQGFVWQGEHGGTETRPPDLQGDLVNTSLTHLGSIEVIKIDQKEKPVEVDFIPFDDIWSIMFAPPSLFRAAKIFYDNEKDEEIVYIPAIYGVSWFSDNQFDHDGSITRFCCHIETKNGIDMGIGIGHKDFKITDLNRNMNFFGISSVGEILVGLEINDPKFEIKCKARGLDPDEVKKQVET